MKHKIKDEMLEAIFVQTGCKLPSKLADHHVKQLVPAGKVLDILVSVI